MSNGILPHSSRDIGSIYAIGMDGSQLVKIGSTRDSVRARMAALQTGAPRQLNVKQEIRVEHPQVIEHWLHAFLADVRVHGEWFKVDHVELPALVTQAMRDLQQMESATPALKTPVSFVRPFGRQRRVTIRISRAMAEQLQVVMEARHQAQQLSSISVLCREALEHYLTCHTFQTTSLPEQGD